MRKTSLRSTLVLGALLVTAFVAPARSADEEKTPEAVLVVRRPLTVHLELSGSFVPQGAVSVAYEPEVYGGALEVVDAVGPGRVVAGQELVRFDEEQIRRDLKDRERDLYVQRARLEKQKAEFHQKQVHTRLGLERSEQNLAKAELTLKQFLEIHKPTRIARSEYGLQGMENRIKDAVEELDQLEKMYEADDLTEETEEIVIRRSRRSLARLRQSFEWQKQSHELLLEVTLPREQADHEYNLARARIDHETYKVTAETDLRRAELELDKAKDAYEEAEKKLASLKADRDALRVRAPRDGYAVPGGFQGTSWSDIAGMRRALKPGGRLKARQVLYTIVTPGDVDVVASVGEGDLSRVKVGQSVTVVPAVDETKALEAVVTEVLPVGQKGRYAVAMDLRETMPALMPGMGCKLKVAVRRVEDALTVPAGALAKDTVWVLSGDEVEARRVVTGAKAEGRVEILSGLKEGERVLKTPPEEKTK